MKEQLQLDGVRKWFGDDFVSIQTEVLDVIQGHYSNYGEFILAGCVADVDSVGAGLICLNNADGFKICRFAGAEGVVFPIYLKSVKTEQTRQYVDGLDKAISYNYTAELSATNDDNYLELKADGTTARFIDAIQDATHRFVTDTEKTSYAGQAQSAINTLRANVNADYDTLEKLKQYVDESTPDAVDAQIIYNTLRDGVDVSLDTLLKIVDYINGLSYFPEYRGNAELAVDTINWTGKPELYRTLTQATQLDASNLIVGKTIGLLVNGAYALTFTSKFKKVFGSPDPSTTSTNYIQMKCIKDNVGAEVIIYSVTFITL